ncbi:MAG: histone deacetylase, partial [Candidatus Eremiobacteraeota bacterium]|nr:histone deacetylase [Candidatus Eremiobacteraeota bacterium]
IHQENIYPYPKQKSDLDVGLPEGTGDDEYLGRLRRILPSILEFHKPELVIYLAGTDPYKDDRLGSLALTKEGMRQRDEMVLSRCFYKQIPVAVLLAGGYAYDFKDTIQLHVNCLRVARELFSW